MKRNIAFGTAGAFIVLAALMSRPPGQVTAVTNGPAIVIGAPSGAVVPVNAVLAPAPYNAMNVHVVAVAGPGVVLSSITGSGSGSTLDGGANGIFCATQAPASTEVIVGCVSLDGPVAGDGLLANITVHATGTGCVTARLINVPDTDGNASAVDTYTAEQSGASEVRQLNTVGAGSVNVFIGGGTVADCVDSDADGCTNAEEAGLNHILGGDRDPANPWDFADMFTPALPSAAAVRTRAVNISDVIAVLSWIGTANNSVPNALGNDYDSDTNFNGLEDGAEYDRTTSSDLSKPWRSGPPNGSVAIADAIVMLAQIGDHC